MKLSGESHIATHRPQVSSKGGEKRKWNRGREHDWRSLRHKATLSFSVSSAHICWTLPGYQPWTSKDRCLPPAASRVGRAWQRSRHTSQRHQCSEQDVQATKSGHARAQQAIVGAQDRRDRACEGEGVNSILAGTKSCN